MDFQRILPFVVFQNHKVSEARPEHDAIGDIAFPFEPARIRQGADFVLEYPLGDSGIGGEPSR